MAVDGDGGTYLLGSIGDSGFAPTNPSYGPPSSSYGNAVVMKLDSQGTLVWSTILYAGVGYALAIDSTGNVYLAGSADGRVFPTTSGAFQTRLNHPGAAFVAKLNPGGLLEWATLLGSEGTNSSGYAIAADATGVYVAGEAYGSAFPTTPGAFRETPGPLTTAGNPYQFITKLNPTGSALLFSTFLSSARTVESIAIENSGAVYVLGGTSASGFPLTAGAYQSTGCLSLAKLNPAGSALIFSTFLSVECTSSGLSVDAAGNSYVAVGPGFGAVDTRILKINPTGTGLVYSRTLPGNLGVTLGAVVADSSGNAFVAGATASSDLPIQSSCFPLVAGIPVKGTQFVLRLDPLGEIADGGYLPIAPDPTQAFPIPLLLKMDASGNIHTTNGEKGLIVVRKFGTATSAGPPVRLQCVANSGSLGKLPVAPGEIVGLFGDGIGPEQAANLVLDASGKVANVLANTQVLFDGIPAPLLYAQRRQINAVVPWEIKGHKTTEICVVYLGEKTNCIQAPVSETSPGFFKIQPHYIAALNQDGSVNSLANPATRDSIVTLYLTGTGPSVPPASDGEVVKTVLSGGLPVYMALSFIVGGLQNSTVETPAAALFHGPAPALVSGVEIIQIRASSGQYIVRMLSSTGEVSEDRGYINTR